MIQSIRRSFDHRLIGRAAAVVVAALALSACDDDPVDQGPTHRWDAEIVGEGEFEDITGAAAVLSNSVAFSAAIEIEGAPADAVFAWAVQEGTCEDPGDRVGAEAAYPDLEADDDGFAEAEADDGFSMSDEEDYVVTITDESGDDAVTVACSVLVLDED